MINNKNKLRIQKSFNRAAQDYMKYGIAQKEILSRLLDRLSTIKLQPKLILDAGSGLGSANNGLKNLYTQAKIVNLDLAHNMLKSISHPRIAVNADIEKLPFENNSFELIFANLSIQWCNLETTLREFRRVLKPNGLLVFSTLGPETFKEFNLCWKKANSKQKHVNNFMDMHDIGDLLLQTKFFDPIMERQDLTVYYKNVKDIIVNQKKIGCYIKISNQDFITLTPKNKFNKMIIEYEKLCKKPQQYPLSYEIIYGIAWKELDKKFQNTEIKIAPHEISRN